MRKRPGDPHQVTLTKGFYLGKYEVTQAQYAAVMAGNGRQNASPSNWHGYPNRPVERVSWDDVQVFLKRLNDQQAANIPAVGLCSSRKPSGSLPGGHDYCIFLG